MVAVSGKPGPTSSAHAAGAASDFARPRVETVGLDGNISERPSLYEEVHARCAGVLASPPGSATTFASGHVGAGARTAVPSVVA